MRMIRQNIKPIALIICCTAVGGMFGHFLTGFLAGVAIVAFATIVTN